MWLMMNKFEHWPGTDCDTSSDCDTSGLDDIYLNGKNMHIKTNTH